MTTERTRTETELPLEMKYRMLLWLGHGHIIGLYGDDGEMQCSDCRVDYKRDALENVEAAAENAKMQNLRAALASRQGVAPTPPSPWTRATEDVLAERAKQDRKWGEQNHDPFTYLTVLIEEVGEFAQAALHLRFGGEAAAGFRKEAVQTAAVALAIVECIDRDKWTFRTDVDNSGLPLPPTPETPGGPR